MSWCTVESDPGVFSELIAKLGVPDVNVEEVYGLEELHTSDEGSSIRSEVILTSAQKYGLIFLFKYNGTLKDDRATIPFEDTEASGMFFAQQVVQDACATQAILSVLLNSDIDLG